MDLINYKGLYEKAAQNLSPEERDRLRVAALIEGIGEEFFNDLFSTDSKETIIDSGTANSKNSHTFTDNTKQFTIRAEKVTKISYSFDETRFDDGNTLTITSGGFLKLSGIKWTGKTIYFSADKNNINVEILELF